jgi:RimJ/RimL family protein N-acetyltransferase
VALPLVVNATATTPGLLLRLWAEQDVPALVEAHRDRLMRRWLLHPITSAEQARRVIEARTADARGGTGFSFAILETAADGEAKRVVGGVSLRLRAAGAAGAGASRAQAATAEVGYWVAAPARGRGVAPRALDAACEWAFSTIDNPPLRRLELIHAVGNRASCRVAEKAGFTLSAVLPPLPPQFPADGHLHVRVRP